MICKTSGGTCTYARNFERNSVIVFSGAHRNSVGTYHNETVLVKKPRTIIKRSGIFARPQFICDSLYFCTLSNSISNISVEFAGIGP